MSTEERTISTDHEVERMIAQLTKRRMLLDDAIVSLTLVSRDNPIELTFPRAGRTSVGPEERRNTSERMKKRWAERRKKKEKNV